MRRYLYNVMLFAAVCLVGCQSEQLVEGNVNDKNTRTIEIFAKMGGDANSRTLLDDEGQLIWQEGDALSVIMGGSTKASKFQITELSEDKKSATFKGEVENEENQTESQANVAFYPYKENIGVAISEGGLYSLTTSIPAEQSWGGSGTFAQGTYPMMAVTDGADSEVFAFKNVLAGTQLHVKALVPGTKIVKVQMAVVENYPLAGDYIVTANKDGIQSVTPSVEENKTKSSITLEYADGVELSTEKATAFAFVHFPIEATEEPKNFIFTLTDSNGGTMVFEQSTTKAFSKSKFMHLGRSNPIKYSNDEVTKRVSVEEDLINAINNPDIKFIVLEKDVTLPSTLVINRDDVVLDGNGKTLISNDKGSNGRAINVSGAEGVTITNLTIKASGERAINIIQGATKVTIDNVNATCDNYAVNVAGSASNAVVNIVNSNLTGLNVVNVGGSNATITINNTTINCVDDTDVESYGAISLNKDAKGSQIIATDVIVNISDDSVIAVNAAEGGEIIVDGSKDGVILPKAYIDYGNYQYLFNTIDEAIKYAKDGEIVNFIRNVEIVETISIEKNVTINLNGYHLDASSNTSRPFEMADGSKLTIEGENSNIKVGKFGLVNIPSGNDAEVILNGGTYEGNTDNGSFLKPRGKGKISLSLNGVTYEDKSDDGFVMDASAYNGDDLSLTINGCTLKAAGGLICLVGKASITNTTLETTQSGYKFAAIEMSGAGSGTIQDSKIKSEGIAVSAGYGASIQVTNCNVEGKEYAYCVYQSGGSINVTTGAKGKYSGNVGIYGKLYDPSQTPGATGNAKIVIDNITVASASL